MLDEQDRRALRSVAKVCPQLGDGTRDSRLLPGTSTFDPERRPA
jgi:hypothetical protein